MNWTGLLRTMQPEIMSAVGFVLFLTIVLILARYLIKNTGSDSINNSAQIKSWMAKGYAIIIILIAIGLMWRMAVLMAVDRMPRHDVDRSGVYEQMEQNREEAKSNRH